MPSELKPKNYSSLYTAIKCHPEYREWQDVAGRRCSNADDLIHGWIWQSTSESKWQKRDLTMDEYRRIVRELYALAGKRPRTRLPVGCRADDPKQAARRSLMAAWHRRLKLLREDRLPGYVAAPSGYVVSCIMRSCGGKYENFNDIPLWELRVKYQRVCAVNRAMEDAL